MSRRKSLPTMFVGSSSEGVKVAEALSERLKDSAEVTIWNEGVFDLNRGTLEELINAVEEFDFAALVMTPDDMTESREQSTPSPRDNVLFECGLFIGHLGRDRTFIVYDGSNEVKIPSDLAGVTLATYDGDRIATNPHAAVRGACARITRAMERSEYSRAYRLLGDWKSRYHLTVGQDHPVVEDDIEIKPSGGKIYLASKENPHNDDYIAYGYLVRDRHLVGNWQSVRQTANAYGAFFLTIHPWGNIMYGYFAGPDIYNRILHSPWVMARKDARIDVKTLLDQGDEILRNTSTIIQRMMADKDFKNEQ